MNDPIPPPPADIRAQLDHLQREVQQLRAENQRLRAENTALRQQLADAQRAAKRQAAPFARGQRKADPQRPGRKAGQGRFASRATPTPEQVTETKFAPLPACPHCGGEVCARREHEQFQIDLPPVQPIVTRFVSESGYCPGCARRVEAAHPEQISTAHGAAGVVLGPRVKAWAADLHHRLGLSYGKIRELLREVFGLPVTRGGLAQADTRLAAQARYLYDELRALLRASSVAHGDETGWRIGVLSAWLWVFTNQEITLYTIATSRGHEVILNILGREFAGVLVADCFAAYDAAALEEWLQQKCVAHLLRELRELVEQKRGTAAEFAVGLMTLLRDALALKAGATDLRAPSYEAAASRLEDRLDELIAERRGRLDPDQARLAARLRKHRPDILRFLYWEEVEATNNRAERGLRPAVPLRKTGGCNRTPGGAEAHAILMSVLATCRQRAIPILDFLIRVQQCGAVPPSFAPA